jgi:tRNA G18 (ribose-2'-O)-methylase SpoU
MTKIVRVYSENATFQHFETLRRNREKRQHHREFVVEGVRAINLALEFEWTVNGWLYAPERKLSGWATGILDKHPAPVHYELAEPLLAKLSSKEESSELLALVAMPADDLARIPIDPNMLVVIFDRPASPGNLGTLIRSCDALGADGLIITGHAVDLYDPETVSASVGSLFALPVMRIPSPRDLEPWFATVQDKLGSVQIVGTSAKADRPITQQDWTQPTVLVIGNETTGLSAHYRQRCDTLVTIPQMGAATSLNVACAASIMLYEIQRQRSYHEHNRHRQNPRPLHPHAAHPPL